MTLDRTLRQRWSLYVQYKTYNVESEELKIDTAATPLQNYKTLFILRRKIEKCLQARRTVHQMYNDNDAGHQQAITFTEEQLSYTDQLLRAVCNEINAATKVEEEAAQPHDDGKEGLTLGPERQKKTKKMKKKKKRASVMPQANDAELVKESEREWQVLEELSRERIRLMQIAFHQIVGILSHEIDKELARPLVETILTNQEAREKHMYILQCILCMALKRMFVPADTPLTLQMTTSFSLASWNTAYPPSADALRDAVLSMCDEMLLKTRARDDLVKNCGWLGDRSTLMSFETIYRLAEYVFDTCFDLQGDYTTKSTVTVIMNVVESICLMVEISRSWTITMLEENARALAYFKKEYGETQVGLMEETLKHLIGKIHPLPPLRVRIAWGILRRCPVFVLSVRTAQLSIAGNGERRVSVPFIIYIQRD